MIAKAIWAKDLMDLSDEEINYLGELQYADDPDVSFDPDDYRPDAGADLHGVNTEEEMMGTVKDYPHA